LCTVVIIGSVGTVMAQSGTPPTLRAPIAPASPGATQGVPLGAGFTYQGQLKNANGPVNGVCDFQFSLWDDVSAGAQVGSTQSTVGVSVNSGLFTVQLNDAGQFGANAFNGLGRWVQVAVKCASDPAFITLSPRQPLTPTPYALALPGLRTEQNPTSPNIIGGAVSNTVTSGVGATIGGGEGHSATGSYATIPGGLNNSAGAFSLAAGRRAKAVNTGSFVWADSTNADFASTADNQFAIRAANGQYIANDAGSSKTVPVGTRYRDNAIVAWARVTAAGGLDSSFNVASVTRISAGRYGITLSVSLSSGFSLIPIVTPEFDAVPTGAADARFVATNQVAAGNTFEVYIYNGNFALVDNDFQVLVTGR